MLIHRDKIRWLLWLRWKTFLRAFTRPGKGKVGRIISRIVLILVLLWAGFWAAFLFFAAGRFLPAPANFEATLLLLTALNVLWLVLPLLEFNTNEGLDLTKLALFPLTRGEKMLSLVLSTLLDTMTLGLLLVFAGLIAGWAFSLPLVLFSIVTVLVFYVQVIGIGQLILSLLMSFLQSRRFRDLGVFLIVLISFSGYLCQFVSRGIFTENFINNLSNHPYSPYLQWLPPGMAARAIEQASLGNWGQALLWLLALLAVGVVALFLWQMIVERAVVRPEVDNSARRVRRRSTSEAVVPSTAAAAPVTASGPRPALLERLFPTPALSLLGKDLKYMRRDPQITGALLQSVLAPVFVVAVTLFNATSGGGTHANGFSSWSTLLLVPLMVCLSLYRFSYNILGFERQSLGTLFLFPIKPWHILWGKNLVTFTIGIVELVILVPVAMFLSHSLNLLVPVLAGGFSAIFVVVGLGNLTSVFFPQQWRQIQRGFQTSMGSSSEAGCMRAVMSLVTLAVLVVVMVPVLLALGAPLFFGMTWLWSLTAPLSLVYGVLVYIGITSLVTPRLLNRSPEILSVVTRA
ncbi:hypothetical protein KSC_051810 [Ktedonobacter sp. SOSP1-52]|uniref:hypothetical protein n=1 Tax=Ktedonobacter sp. SOSP1-52 TaxID=2778366 RepID=UPI0019158152|nr:hypothetical protein [Ktedonobacter sp. SOSP1-52]GHO66289.1 hypothetical protein KSC_051810 [Ktedonobacter sp. SOSP1-52]